MSLLFLSSLTLPTALATAWIHGSWKAYESLDSHAEPTVTGFRPVIPPAKEKEEGRAPLQRLPL